mmetsp:Transcript_20886/g.52773  ORF Transcript_20886/g.52773 Transcript_20886/m.52773 type:complete len:206 (+) Transcript_20886:551-1168(+)
MSAHLNVNVVILFSSEYPSPVPVENKCSSPSAISTSRAPAGRGPRGLLNSIRHSPRQVPQPRVFEHLPQCRTVQSPQIPRIRHPSQNKALCLRVGHRLWEIYPVLDHQIPDDGCSRSVLALVATHKHPPAVRPDQLNRTDRTEQVGVVTRTTTFEAFATQVLGTHVRKCCTTHRRTVVHRKLEQSRAAHQIVLVLLEGIRQVGTG